jgi:hypothetical protein
MELFVPEPMDNMLAQLSITPSETLYAGADIDYGAAQCSRSGGG